MIYPTKKDRWLVLIVFGSGIYLLGVTIVLIVTKGFRPETWIPVGAAMFYISIIRLLAYPVYYEITPVQIIIRSGLLLRYIIPVPAITRVIPTRNPLSAPAWSLDRLKIEYLKKGKTRYILISPENRETFLQELNSINGNIKFS